MASSFLFFSFFFFLVQGGGWSCIQEEGGGRRGGTIFLTLFLPLHPSDDILHYQHLWRRRKNLPYPLSHPPQGMYVWILISKVKHLKKTKQKKNIVCERIKTESPTPPRPNACQPASQPPFFWFCLYSSSPYPTSLPWDPNKELGGEGR